MAAIELRQVRKSYDGRQPIIHGIDLEVRKGEFVVFVGPSGCGKSTLLRMIAGLESISGGEVLIDGEVVNDRPPRARDIAMVFQDYALYPHKTLFENMAFGLRLRKTPEAEIQQRVGEAAALLRIEHLLQRKPRELSGGQRQRVAIGRAIVRQPKVFLFDEPLSNLDAQLRNEMRAEIKRLHQRLKATIVYVTHDQTEAMTLADRICVLQGGHKMQFDTPEAIYNRPAAQFVAGFTGAPPMNLLPCAVNIDHADLGDGLHLPLPADAARLRRPAAARRAAREPAAGRQPGPLAAACGHAQPDRAAGRRDPAHGEGGQPGADRAGGRRVPRPTWPGAHPAPGAAAPAPLRCPRRSRAACRMKRLLALVLGLLLSLSVAAETRLRVFVGGSNQRPDLMRILFDRYLDDKPGLRIDIETGGATSDLQRQYLSTVLNARDDALDAFLIDIVNPAQYFKAGWLEPLDAHLGPAETLLAPYLPVYREANVVNGRVAALPAFADAMFMYYRRDLLAKYGLAAPRTWDELGRTARRPSRGRGRAAAAGPEPAGRPIEGAVCTFLLPYWSQGKAVQDAQGRSVFDAPAAARGLQQWLDLMDAGVIKRNIAEVKTPDTVNEFKAGKVLFALNWSWAWDRFEKDADSQVKGKVGLMPLPA